VPVKIRKGKSGYVVSTPGGTKAKGTTKKKAEAQARLLNAGGTRVETDWEEGWKGQEKRLDMPLIKPLEREDYLAVFNLRNRMESYIDYSYDEFYELMDSRMDSRSGGRMGSCWRCCRIVI